LALKILKKGTILIPSGTTHDAGRKHLFVVCTDACVEGKHLLTRISSWINDLCDPTCRFAAGEHPFIKHTSYLLYRKSRIELGADLVKGLDNGMLAPHDPINGQTFLRIVTGICRSPQTPRKFKIYAGCPGA